MSRIKIRKYPTTCVQRSRFKKHEKQKFAMECLPIDCWILIFDYLPIEDLLNLAESHRLWRRIILYDHSHRYLKNVPIHEENYTKIPLENVTGAKLVERHCSRQVIDFAFRNFSSSLTHLELDVPFQPNSKLVKRMKNVRSLSLGCRTKWCSSWKSLEKLEIEFPKCESSLPYISSLPKTLKTLVCTKLDTDCLRPCRESLIHLEIPFWAKNFKFSFPRLETLIVGTCGNLPDAVPRLQHFECTSFQIPANFEPFISSCRLTLKTLFAPRWNFHDFPDPFPRLQNLSLNKFSRSRRANNFPELRSLTILSYTEPDPYDEATAGPEIMLPLEARALEKLILLKGYKIYGYEKNYRAEFEKTCFCNLLKYAKTLQNLKIVKLKEFSPPRIYDVLKAMTLSNLKELHVRFRSAESLDLTWLDGDLDVLKLNGYTVHVLPVLKLPHSRIKTLIIGKYIRFVVEEDKIVNVERLSLANFYEYGDFLSRCLEGGLRVLTVDTGIWESVWPEDFFRVLKSVDRNALIAVYVSIAENLRKRFKCELERCCPLLQLCEFTTKGKR